MVKKIAIYIKPWFCIKLCLKIVNLRLKLEKAIVISIV